MSDMDGTRSLVPLGNGVGYEDKNGKLCMIRCFSCGRENWAPAVASLV